MYCEINEKIYTLKGSLRIKEKLESLLKMNRAEFEKKNLELVKLGNILKKEKRDVTKLEGISISSMFLDILGKKEDKLDKEREEFLVAKIKYEECLIDIKELESQKEYCNQELKLLYGIQNEYENLIKEKEKLMLHEDSQESKLLKDYQYRSDNLKLEQKEIEEAIDAGKISISSLSIMKDHLGRAKSWGVWDMMGGGLISNIAKHSAIDDANSSGKKVTQSLKLFKKELSDVDKFTDIDVNISSFTKFADFFFDGFFVDWFVQSKINDSISNVTGVERNIKTILGDLNINLKDLEKEQRRIDSEVKTILES